MTLLSPRMKAISRNRAWYKGNLRYLDDRFSTSTPVEREGEATTLHIMRKSKWTNNLRRFNFWTPVQRWILGDVPRRLLGRTVTGFRHMVVCTLPRVVQSSRARLLPSRPSGPVTVTSPPNKCRVARQEPRPLVPVNGSGRRMTRPSTPKLDIDPWHGDFATRCHRGSRNHSLAQGYNRGTDVHTPLQSCKGPFDSCPA